VFFTESLIGALVHPLGLVPIATFQNAPRPAHSDTGTICPSCLTIPQFFCAERRIRTLAGSQLSYKNHMTSGYSPGKNVMSGPPINLVKGFG
jgi:hypothetical protein